MSSSLTTLQFALEDSTEPQLASHLPHLSEICSETHSRTQLLLMRDTVWKRSFQLKIAAKPRDKVKPDLDLKKLAELSHSQTSLATSLLVELTPSVMFLILLVMSLALALMLLAMSSMLLVISSVIG